MSDPLDALHLPVTPHQPDPQFAARLRARMVRALPGTITEETTTMTTTTLPRNGRRHGDISYVTLGLPDIVRGRAFYGTILGWTFGPGSSQHGAQVEGVIPMLGLWDGPTVHGDPPRGAVLGFRVDDIEAAVGRVREAGGVATEPRREPYGVTADATDDQGMHFYLHGEMGDVADPSLDLANGAQHGDVSYVSIRTPSSARTRAFYAHVLGRRSLEAGAVVGLDATTPMIGVAEVQGRPVAVVLSYRVDDIATTVANVREAGGTATDPAQRPYGAESDCADDQGTPFYLHQLTNG